MAALERELVDRDAGGSAATAAMLLDGSAIPIHSDATALRQAEEAPREGEERFRVMADTMPAMLWLDDAEGRCIFVNKTWLDYTGRTLEEELGLGWAAAMHPDDLARTLVIEGEARRTRQPFTEVYRVRRHDGVYRWFLDTGAPRVDGSGMFLGFIGTLMDITDQRRLEEELHQAQKMEAIGQLTGGVAHDFNNLLTVISGNLEMALARIGDPRAADMLRMALEAAGRGAALTQHLLAFARRQALSPQAIELGGLVSGLGVLLERTLGAGIKFVGIVPPDPWPALVDPSQLENALLNLALNARDAMPGGGRLTIAIANRDFAAERRPEMTPGRYVELAVTDTGQGMSPEIREQAVQPFFTTKGLGKGNGLGLSMVYGFVSQSGGYLRIDSEPGRGTTVRLYLPVAPAGSKVRQADVDVEPLAPTLGSILVVDDDPDVLGVTVSMLDELGFRVTTAADADSALRWLDEGGPFELLLSDVILPGSMNGVDLARAAMARLPGLKVLLMSGYTESAYEGAEVVAPLLAKPFRKRQLVEQLRQLLGA